VTRRPPRLLLALAALALLGGGGYAVWRQTRPRPAGPPPIELANVDPMVAKLITTTRDAVAEDPLSSAAWGKLGMVLYAHDFNTEAVACFARAEELDPTEMRWPYYQGVILAAEHTADAVAALQRAAERGRDPLPRLRLGENLYTLERLDEAEAQYRKANVGRDDEPRRLLGLGQIAWRRGDYKAAVPLLERAAKSPHCARNARANLADAQERLGNTAEAERLQAEIARLPKDTPWPDHLLERVVELQTGTRARLNQVNALLSAGQTSEAVDLCRKVAHDDPNSDVAHLALGRALMQARDFNAAVEVLTEGTRRWPNSLDAHLLLGGALTEIGRFDDAAKSFRRATELNPSFAPAHYHLATCLRRSGDRPGARRALAEAIHCRPELVRAHVELGELLLEDGDAAGALVPLRDALRLDPANERAQKLLADAEAKVKAAAARPSK
jgi:tetratricopeptide (TPR) repeat protein